MEISPINGSLPSFLALRVILKKRNPLDKEENNIQVRIDHFKMVVPKTEFVQFELRTAKGLVDSDVNDPSLLKAMGHYLQGKPTRLKQENCSLDGTAVFFGKKGEVVAEFYFSLICEMVLLGISEQKTTQQLNDQGIPFQRTHRNSKPTLRTLA